METLFYIIFGLIIGVFILRTIIIHQLESQTLDKIEKLLEDMEK